MDEGQIITKIEDIHKWRPFKNRVLLRVIENKEKEIAPGVVIDIDTRWKRGTHMPRVGEVIKVPEKLVLITTGQAQTRWMPHMELEVGDMVWGEGIHFESAEKFLCDGKFYIAIDYQNLIVAKRRSDNYDIKDKDGEWKVVMLNGRVLLEPDAIETSKFLVEKNIKSNSVGTVIFAGSSNLWYKMKNKVDADEVQTGDKVMFKTNGHYPLEDKMWASFDNGRIYYVVQRCEIMAIL